MARDFIKEQVRLTSLNRKEVEEEWQKSIEESYKMIKRYDFSHIETLFKTRMLEYKPKHYVDRVDYFSKIVDFYE